MHIEVTICCLKEHWHAGHNAREICKLSYSSPTPTPQCFPLFCACSQGVSQHCDLPVHIPWCYFVPLVAHMCPNTFPVVLCLFPSIMAFSVYSCMFLSILVSIFPAFLGFKHPGPVSLVAVSFTCIVYEDT